VTATVERAAAVPRPVAARPTWVHRPELDGLRTVAVYLVVLFHAEVGLFAGGFIGVDLFFVLSGFLVSSILFDEAARRGTVDVGAFFARRVRRLLPAAVVVVVATSLGSVLTSSLARRLPWIGDAQSALLYVSNWHFLSQSSDYFGADIDKSPFLHFWSLSIEEQFYVGFALVLLLVLRSVRRTTHRTAVLAGIIALLTVGSVLSQVYWAAHDPDRAYYATDARVYQMLAGVLAALLWRRLRAARGERSATRCWGAALLPLAVLVVVATTLVPVSASVRGLAATALAAPMILLVMVDVDPGARWLLTRPAMTYLGRISYGTYLWHWPVVLTLRELFDTGPVVIAVLTATVSTGLAALSFEVLEQPIRRSRRLAGVGFPTVVVGVALSAVVAVTVVPRVLGSERPPAVASQQQQRLPSGEAVQTALPRGAVPAGLDWRALSRQHGLDDRFCTPSDPGDCLLHQGSGPRVLLVGDSHGRVLGQALLDLAKRHDLTLYGSVMSACSWFPHTTSPTQDESERADCHTARDHLYPDLVRALHIDVVVVTQMPRPWLRSDDEPTTPYPEMAAAAVRDVTAAVATTGARMVIVTSMLPTVDDPLGCLSGARDQSECETVQSGHDDLLDSYYLTAAAESPDVATIDVNQVMCPQYPLCAAVLDGLPAWRDSLHYLPANLVAHDGQIWDQLVATGFFTG
jgi:peptidoglycan/LPS O-acetylase OafA/YrhL